VAKRTRKLLEGADETVVYGARPDVLARERDIADRLGALGDDVDATVLTREGVTVDLPESVTVVRLPADRAEDPPDGRILAVDGTALLLSVLASDERSDADETAIWSAETDFARVLIQLFEGWVGNRCS
jgi:hypothetical protein